MPARNDDQQIRKTVSFPAWLWRQIVAWQRAKRIKWDSVAVRSLVIFALNTLRNRRRKE